MKCPRCENSVLDERERDGVTVDVCRECRGIWLDRSELERIVARALREQPQDPAVQPLPAPAPQAPAGYAQQHAPGGYYHRDDDTPAHGYRRDGRHHQPHRKKHWFESLTDIFD